MNGWDALQAYDLVNDGGGNFGFVQAQRDRNFHVGTGLSALFHAAKLDLEVRRREREEGLDKP